MLNKNGNKKINSMSYKIKKIHNIAKFIFICIFKSDMVLKPHSQNCFFAEWFFTL